MPTGRFGPATPESCHSSAIVKSDPARLPALQDTVRSRKLCHIGRSAEEINPGRPDFARHEEIFPGWYVGLVISNSTKMMILRVACDVYRLSIPHDLEVQLPKA